MLKINEEVKQKIKSIRGKKVLLDFELATLYKVPTKVLIQAVKRNVERFPEDFMFQLDLDEWESLRSQFVTSNRGGRRYIPYVFTEQGVAMLSSVLNSSLAIQINIAIMRIFVSIRIDEGNLAVLFDKIFEIKTGQELHQNEIENIYKLIDELLTPNLKREEIGFTKR